MKFIRSFPEICASTRCPSSSSLANMVLGSGSTTVPSTSIASRFATGGAGSLSHIECRPGRADTRTRSVAEMVTSWQPASIASRSGVTHAANGECGHRSAEALELELAGAFHVDRLLDGRHDALADQDFPGLCRGREARREDDRGADRGVVVPALEADAAHGRVAGGDADPETELVAAPPPVRREASKAITHGTRGPDRGELVVGHGPGVVEEDHEPVAGEVLDGALVLDRQHAHGCVVVAKHAEDLFGIRLLGERSEAAQVGEQRGDLSSM